MLMTPKIIRVRRISGMIFRVTSPLVPLYTIMSDKRAVTHFDSKDGLLV